MNGSETDAWDPVPAALAWKAMVNRKIKLLQPVPSFEMLADDSDSELNQCTSSIYYYYYYHYYQGRIN